MLYNSSKNVQFDLNIETYWRIQTYGKTEKSLQFKDIIVFNAPLRSQRVSDESFLHCAITYLTKIKSESERKNHVGSVKYPR